MSDVQGKPVTYEEVTESRQKHLELLQRAVDRLGGNGFLLKGWTVTVTGAFIGFAVDSGNPLLAIASWLPTVAFWGLDAYFLRCERLFREVFRRVSTLDPSLPPFFMAATDPRFVDSLPDRVGSVSHAAWSSTIRTFYGTIIGGVGLVAGLLYCSSR